MPMLSDIMDADTTLYPSSAFVAGLVALSFYIVSLFSVYHRNEEYRQQKEKTNQKSAKLYSCDEEMDVAPRNGNDKIESTALASGVKLSAVSTNYIAQDEYSDVEANTLRSRNSGSASIGKNQALLGSIGIERLHTFDCHNESRRLLSLFGHIFDVTDSAQYTKDGELAMFAGHDITLCMATGNHSEEWLDRFVQLKLDFKESAAQALDGYTKSFCSVGKLNKWSTDRRKWARLTATELKSLNV